jgi:hypothetical protein
MLEDVPGLINPIIQAMIQTSRQQGETADRAQRAQALKDEAAYKQAELKHQQAVLDEQTHNHEQGMDLNRQQLEIYKKQLDAQLEEEGLKRLKTKVGLAGQGVDIGKALAQGAAPDAGIPSQQEQQANILSMLQGKSQAESQGQGQGQIAAQLSDPGQQLFKQQQKAEQDKQDRLFQQQQLLETMKGAQAETMGHNRDAAAASRANIEGMYHLRGIALMHSLGLDSGDGSAANKAKTLLDGIYDGNTDPDKLSKDDKQLVTNYAAANGETVPTGAVFKSYKQVLDNSSTIQGILSQARDAATKYSMDSPNSTSLGNKNMSMGPFGVHSPIPGTDANGLAPGSPASAAIEGLNTTVGKFIPTLEGSNRQSDQNRAAQLKGLVNPKNTQAMNLKNINDKATMMNQLLKTDTQGVNPDRLNVALQKRGIVDFGGQNTSAAYKQTATGPNGHKIGSNDGQKWFDVQTGNPIQ